MIELKFENFRKTYFTSFFLTYHQSKTYFLLLFFNKTNAFTLTKLGANKLASKLARDWKIHSNH